MWYILLTNGDLIPIKGNPLKRDGIPSTIFKEFDTFKYWAVQISKSIATRYGFDKHPEDKRLYIIQESKVDKITWMTKKEHERCKKEIYYNHQYIEEEDGSFKVYFNGFEVNHIDKGEVSTSSSLLTRLGCIHRIIYVTYDNTGEAINKRIDYIE